MIVHINLCNVNVEHSQSMRVIQYLENRSLLSFKMIYTLLCWNTWRSYTRCRL